MSWKPEFLVSGSWCTNGQRFATKQEALGSAYVRFCNWTVPSDYRATESDEPVNQKRVDGRDVEL